MMALYRAWGRCPNHASSLACQVWRISMTLPKDDAIKSLAFSEASVILHNAMLVVPDKGKHELE